jgi:hypothetical protein
MNSSIVPLKNVFSAIWTAEVDGTPKISLVRIIISGKKTLATMGKAGLQRNGDRCENEIDTSVKGAGSAKRIT